jgi:hypothetical protein
MASLEGRAENKISTAPEPFAASTRHWRTAFTDDSLVE